jgi:flagellar biosynthesis/type III secretory pathway protein FliH
VDAFSDGDAALEEMRMAPDKSIRDGDCVIDTPSGMIDARIEKRVEAVESALKSRLKYASPRPDGGRMTADGS